MTPPTPCAAASAISAIVRWFETPAEVEIARRNGADVVGMSIVLETIAARALGAEVIGIAVVANKAATWGGRPIDHTSVSERCRASADKVKKSVRGFLSQTLPRSLASE